MCGTLRSVSRTSVVFSHTVKSFVEHVLVRRGLITPTLRAQLEALGVSVDQPTDVPIESWWKALGVVLPLVAPPSLEPEAAWEFMGSEVVRGFATTLTGKTSFLVLKLLGPRRALQQLSAQFRTADSATEVVSRERSANDVELDYRVAGGLPQPSYVKGLLKTGMELVGAHDVVITWSRVDETASRIIVRWRA